MLVINDAKNEMKLQEKGDENDNANSKLDKLVSTNQEMHQESDNLMRNAVPCGQYQALDSGDPIQLDEMEDAEREQVTKTKRKHKRRRFRCFSQSSNTAIGGRRSTFSTRIGKKSRRRQLYGTSAPPRHVHGNDWREMLEITKQKDEGENIQLAAQSLYRSEDEELNKTDDIGGEELRAVEAPLGDKFSSSTSIPQQIIPSATRECDMARMRYMSGGSSLQCDWIEETFSKRECIKFIPSSKDSNKCGCGRYKHQHAAQQTQQMEDSTVLTSRSKRWSIQKNTSLMPTDAYGTIEFQGGPHPFKAQYLRLSFDSDPVDIMCLFEHIWEMEPPKLIITIHGGITNFDLQPKLARVFRKGLLKAARTTGAWIFTSGVNAGVVRQVAAALESAIPTSAKSRKIVSVGIAPWGLLKRREDFIGRDKVVLYHPQSFPPKTRFAVLNNRHSFFLLVDNGTVGRYGADVILRRRLESYIAEKQKIGGGNRSVPVVCVVLEGGTCTIRTVLDYVTTIPKVPVVICDGSGRASDLLAFAHQYIQEDGNLPEVIRPQLLSLIEDVFFYDKQNAQCLFMDILACVRQRNLITVFRLMGENQKQDVDYAILTALLKGQNLSPAEQLSLALAWNRVDIARSDIFIMGQDWSKNALHNAMMEALIHNRVDFVRLLLENGVSMHEFLTIGRLEDLYNTDQGPPNTLYYIVRDVVRIRAGYRYKLPHIGMAIEKLMANGFRSHYTSTQFRQKYSEYKNKLKETQRRYHHHPISHHNLYHNFDSNDQILLDFHHFPASTTNYNNYRRSNTEFFFRGLGIVPGFRPRGMRTSASDTKLGYGRTLAQPQIQSLNQEIATESAIHGIYPASTGTTARVNSVASQQPALHSFYHQPHFYSTNNFAAIPTVSGSRALSNHLLWRTAYRRENNPAAIKPQPHRKLGMVAQSAQEQQYSLASTSANNDAGAQKFTVTNSVFFNEAIGYAAEADESLNAADGQNKTPDFRYPFSDLLIWAVLTKRHKMALCMWQHGEEAMAKALVACRLYKSLAKEAAEDYLEVEVCEELKKYAEEFMQLSLELLDHCYKQDDAQTLQLLTYELIYWGEETCLSLAVIVNNKQFLAHPCCQILLADLWHGGLRIRSNSNLKVILGILFPPSIFLLEFKSREELMLQPQTAAEHQNDINDTSSSSDSSSSSSSSSDSDSEIEVSDEVTPGGNTTDKALGGAQFLDRRRASHGGSMQSLNFTSIFQSKRKRTNRQASQMANLNGATTTDLELGNAKSRDHHHSHLAHHHSTIASTKEQPALQECKTRAKRSATTRSNNRPRSSNIAVMRSTNQNDVTDKMTEKTNVLALDIGTQHGYIVSDNFNSPVSTQTSRTISQNNAPVIPLQVDTKIYDENEKHMRPEHKTIKRSLAKLTIPQFTLGSIGEYADNEEESNHGGNFSSKSSPKKESHQETSNRTAETAIEDDYPNLNSPEHQHNYEHFNNKEKDERNAQTPITKFTSPTRWDLGQHIGLAKALDYIGGRQTVNGGFVPKGIPLPEGVTLNKKRQIKFRRKLYEFFVAPITTFWAWTLSFLVFLSVLTYVLLVRTPPVPTYFEWYLLAYVVAFGIEITRKFIMSEPKKLLEKLQYFFGNYWNFLTAVAIVGFIIGFVFRLNPTTSRTIGRVVLAVDSVLWTIKLLDFLGVFPRFGPYITMAGKMVMNMSSIVVMLGISLLGFGLARQSITYPNEEWHWLLLRNVFYKPYFMLYGEVYADEIDTCGDEAWDEHLEKNVSIANAWSNRDEHARELSCVPGHWIPPFLMVVFLLIANILLISMLIAIFNNIFESTNKISQQIWLFQRYRQVMEYEATPFLPPPFTPVYHVYMIIRYLSYQRMPSCRCLSAPIGRMLGVTCLCFCSSRRRKISKADTKVDSDQNEEDKVIPLAKNAFEQRQNFQNGDNRSRKQQERLALFDFSLKLFLTDDQVEKLHDFEEECMEDLAREKEYERNRTSEERLHRTCERTEMILLRVNDLSSKETMLKGNVRELETRIELMENKQTEIIDNLRQLNSVMPVLVQSLQFLQQFQQQKSTASQEPQQHGKSPLPQIGLDLTMNIPTSSSFTQIDSTHQASNIIMPAHSEGHICSGKLSLSTAKPKESKDISSKLIPVKPPLYTSLSVEQASSTAGSAYIQKTPTILLPETREQRAQSFGSTLEKQSGGMTSGSTGSSLSTIYYPFKSHSNVNTGGMQQQQQRSAYDTHSAGHVTTQRRTRTTTIGGSDLPSFMTAGLLTPDAENAFHPQQRLFGSVVSLEPNAVINSTGGGVGGNIGGSSITMTSRKNTQRWHRPNDEYTSITDTINVEQIGKAKVSSTMAVPASASVAVTTRVGGRVEDAESIERSIEELEEENQSSPSYMQTERLVDDAVQTEDEDEEDDLEEEEEEAEDEMDEDETDMSSMERRSSRQNRP